MDETWGYLYVMVNDSMPGLVKIGYTRRDPRLRALELFKQATGVPTQFNVAFAIFCPEPDQAEMDVFAELDELRVTKCREFFRIDLEVAIERVASVGLSYCAEGLCARHCDYIVDADVPGSLAIDLEPLLGRDIPPPSMASILSWVTAEEALPAAIRYFAMLDDRAARNAGRADL